MKASLLPIWVFITDSVRSPSCLSIEASTASTEALSFSSFARLSRTRS